MSHYASYATDHEGTYVAAIPHGHAQKVIVICGKEYSYKVVHSNVIG